MWIVIIILFVLLILFNNKQLVSARIRRIYKEIHLLADRVETGHSSKDDLPEWERCLAYLEARPNEFNKLELEIGLRARFTSYLERHYPHDPRLPELQAAAGYRKDTIWGMKMNTWGKK
ncbi:hypothetical protein [Paenibacillus sp. SN-8-1]|uniref:hypothetical protein n=1 Tax=Paenibacillus sp. SN-8-1 TaxID=3435409 RepID=UPI003D9A681A